ncbi:MAG: hypothetical protein ACI8PZ_005461 [Myxococcota bacterium]|jgi:hypothetical protein
MGQAQGLTVIERDGDAVRWAGRDAPFTSIERVIERFDPWTGRAWVHLRGPDWRIPITSDYGPTRLRLRQWFGDRPFRSDWGDGRFPPCPAGWPPALASAVTIGVFTAGAATLAVRDQEPAAVAVLLIGAFALARVRGRVEVGRAGIRIGPAWAPLLPWRQARAVEWRRRGRWADVWARSDDGSASATLPLVLVPALRARVQRLGAIPFVEAEPTLHARYERWVGPATGAPWGVLLGTAAAAAMAPDPWLALTIGLVTAGVLTTLAQAVHARASGWGTGAVMWIVLLYAGLLLVVGAGWRGWLG